MKRKADNTNQPQPLGGDPSLTPLLFGLPVDTNNLDDNEYLSIVLGEQADARRLDSNFWYDESVTLAAALIPVVRRMFFCSVSSYTEWFGTHFEIDIDYNLVHTAALEWIANYGYDLITRVTGTQRELTRQAMDAWVKDGEPLSALIDYLRPVYGETRARYISITEATRAYAEGSLATWRASGVVTGMRWNTAMDDLVCPICAPLDGQIQPLDGGTFDAFGGFGGVGSPPGHVSCRCWLTPVVDEPKLLIAQTSRKERLAALDAALKARGV